ncbi:hypothetical protein [Burkholderia sp. BDU5]|uniref:hypothetical protein n=1 Tax=Burkholderia sp. BDU5 TaxID=1385590 RepID=UPI0012E3E430|nr:hypothetical protein [Burkholderia sp. BDU5]
MQRIQPTLDRAAQRPALDTTMQHAKPASDTIRDAPPSIRNGEAARPAATESSIND